MSLKVERVETWAAPLADAPGRMATLLGALSSAGVALDFIHARRSPEKPGTGVLFVAPIKGAAGVRAAQKAGFRKTLYLHTVRVEGPDKTGQGHLMTQALAEQGLNLSALSASVVHKKFLAHIALDSENDADKAVKVLSKL